MGMGAKEIDAAHRRRPHPLLTSHARPLRVRGRQPHWRPPPRLAGGGLDLVGDAEAGHVGDEVSQPRRGQRRQPKPRPKHGLDLFARDEHDKVVDEAEADKGGADRERDADERAAVDGGCGRRGGRRPCCIVQPQRAPKLGGVQGAGRGRGVGRGKERVGVGGGGREDRAIAAGCSPFRRFCRHQDGQQLLARGGREAGCDGRSRGGRRGQGGPQRVCNRGGRRRGRGGRRRRGRRRRAARGGHEHWKSVGERAPAPTDTLPLATMHARSLLLLAAVALTAASAAAAPTAADVRLGWARARRGGRFGGPTTPPPRLAMREDQTRIDGRRVAARRALCPSPDRPRLLSSSPASPSSPPAAPPPPTPSSP